MMIEFSRRQTLAFCSIVRSMLGNESGHATAKRLQVLVSTPLCKREMV